jgi:hypothetical protein
VASEYLLPAVWGLALLAAIFGWGRWLARLLRCERVHVGLSIAWGYAVLLSLGGWLCWLEVAGRNALAALVGIGLTGLLLRTPSAPEIASDAAHPDARATALRVGVASACVVLLGLGYALGLFDGRYQGADDRGAYFMHARKILETGTLYEPFSFRRLASYGGQAFCTCPEKWTPHRVYDDPH